jgi:Meiotically up-regulated gene 113
LLNSRAQIQEPAGDGSPMTTSRQPTRSGSSSVKSCEGSTKGNSVVYFMASGAEIKIGFTSDLSSRMAQLRYDGHKDAELIAAIYGGRAIEKALHTKLARYRVKGEWFKDCAEVRSAIQNSLNNFERADHEFSNGRGENIFIPICRLLWPTRAAEHLAEESKCSVRQAERFLGGHSDWSGDAIGAVVAEILKRHAMRNAFE